MTALDQSNATRAKLWAKLEVAEKASDLVAVLLILAPLYVLDLAIYDARVRAEGAAK